MTVGKQKPTREVAELAELRRARTEIAARLDQVSADQRAASETLTAAREALAQLERRAANGGPVTDDERREAERELEVAITKAGQPWQERADGLRRAVGDADARIGAHVAANLDALAAELYGRSDAIDDRTHGLIAALLEQIYARVGAEQELIGFVSLVGRHDSNDVPRSRLDGLRLELERVQASGGEVALRLAHDPRLPRHGEAAEVEQQAAAVPA